MNINYNSVQHCLKYTANLTENVYHNVCNGSMYSVPNGFWDYLVMGGISGMLIGITLFIPFMIYKIVTDW